MTCMFPRRKNTPIRISTIGPAKERFGRIGGVGGGACTVLAIVHLAIHLRGRLLRRRCGVRRSRWRDIWASAKVPALHQFQNSDDEQNNWPCAVPARPVHVIDQLKRADADQNCRSSDAAMPA